MPIATGLAWFCLLSWAFRAFNVFMTMRHVPRLPEAPPRSEGAGELLSIVVPARDEERDIGRSTRSKLSIDDPAFEVVVVDDGSTDATPAILEDLRKEFPNRLRVISGQEPPEGWLGKPHALHQGALAARATRPSDWLCFSDADIRFERDLLARAFAHARREKLDFLTLFPTLEAETAVERFLAPTVATVACCYAPVWLVNTRRGGRFGAGAGVFNLVRRGLYDAIGGHAALRNSVVDDIQLGRAAARKGGRVGIAFALDSVRVRMYHGLGETVRGFRKNLYFGLGGRLFTAVPLLLLFAVEGLFPWAYAAAGALNPGFRGTAFALSLATVALTIGTRAALHAFLGYSVALVPLHPVWVAALTFIGVVSTWTNGVLSRNVWRGRVRDARSLKT